MTILESQRKLVPFSESRRPNYITYVREGDSVGVAPDEMMHVDLALTDGLGQNLDGPGKPEVDDAGIIIIEPNDTLTINSYRSSSTQIRVFFSEFTDYRDLQEAFRRVRRETARVVANRTGMNVKIQFDTGEDEVIQPG